MWRFLAKIFSVRVRGAWYSQLLNLIKINIVQLPSARIAQINNLIPFDLHVSAHQLKWTPLLILLSLFIAVNTFTKNNNLQIYKGLKF